MLTILEATAAIKSLDTAPDIIKQACQKVLGLDGLKNLDESALAKHIVLNYIPQVDSSKVLIALTLALGQLAAVKVKPGHEDQLLINLMKQIRHEMYSFQSFQKKIRAIIPEDILDKMSEALAKQLKGLPE